MRYPQPILIPENHSTVSMIVDTYFSATIADTLLSDHDPRIIVEYEKHSD
jgi:hypothetical protein